LKKGKKSWITRTSELRIQRGREAVKLALGPFYGKSTILVMRSRLAKVIGGVRRLEKRKDTERSRAVKKTIVTGWNS